MKSYRYLYIDDITDKANDLVKGFNRDRLNIQVAQNKGNWKDQLNIVFAYSNDIEGLIIDLKLNDAKTEDGSLADFMGSSVATEIRSRQKSGEMNYFPIVLISANDKIKKSFDYQESAIFDMIIDKGELDVDYFKTVENRLYTLAEAYLVLNDILKKGEVFDVSNLVMCDQTKLDDRFISAFLFKLRTSKPDTIVRFLLKKLILHQGLLINEDVLAARLGIDKDDSDNWTVVLKLFESCQYNGILSDGWRRWWMPLVDEVWGDISKEKPYLQMLTAGERVETLKANGIDKITVAKKLPKADSTRFWTVCQAYNKPLDPIDGLMIIGQESLSPWLEPLYVSIEGALRRKNHEKWKDIEGFEISKLNLYQKH